MSDARMRTLERAAQQGDPQAAVALFLARGRAGEFACWGECGDQLAEALDEIQGEVQVTLGLVRVVELVADGKIVDGSWVRVYGQHGTRWKGSSNKVRKHYKGDWWRVVNWGSWWLDHFYLNPTWLKDEKKGKYRASDSLHFNEGAADHLVWWGEHLIEALSPGDLKERAKGKERSRNRGFAIGTQKSRIKHWEKQIPLLQRAVGDRRKDVGRAKGLLTRRQRSPKKTVGPGGSWLKIREAEEAVETAEDAVRLAQESVAHAEDSLADAVCFVARLERAVRKEQL